MTSAGTSAAPAAPSQFASPRTPAGVGFTVTEGEGVGDACGDDTGVPVAVGVRLGGGLIVADADGVRDGTTLVVRVGVALADMLGVGVANAPRVGVRLGVAVGLTLFVGVAVNAMIPEVDCQKPPLTIYGPPVWCPASAWPAVAPSR